MDLGLEGKYALVTGSSHGIGRAIVEGLASEGCHVCVCGRNNEHIDETVKSLESNYNVEVLTRQADLDDPNQINNTIDTIKKNWGALHILVNNVGGGGRWGSEIVEETDLEVWQQVFNRNVWTAVQLTTAFLPMMRSQHWGRIIAITSTYGREGGGRPWFNISKTAQTSLMKTLAKQHYLTRDGITFNSVAPGPIMIPDTGWEAEQKRDPIAFQKMIDKEIVLGRLGLPSEVADMVVFLCSERASLINGASIFADGGQSNAF